jgi:tetratricopeptide (TPR) repeat protein
MAKGPKVVRRDLREDKVYVTLAEVVDVVVRNRLWIAVGALGALAVFAAAYFWTVHSRQVAAEASWALYQADFVELPSEKRAALEKVATEHPRSPAGIQASFEAANLLFETGRYEDALAAFRAFSSAHPSHLLAPAADEAAAQCLEALGRWDEAAETYRTLIRTRPEDPVGMRANYRLGLCYERSGDKDKAIEAYQKTITLLPGTLWADYATERLAMLKPSTVKLSDN